jgi:short-subunit dehydrogenase
VLVTGASSGIGMGLAEEFARRGAVLAISGRDRERLAATAAACRAHGATVHELVADLGDPAAVDRLAAETLAALGGVDVLVNNAGIPKRRDVTQLTPDVVETVMTINYFSPVRLTLALLPGLIQRAGRIVNISSVAARLGPPGEAAYAATKAAITAFSESMAVDLRDTEVGVHVVNPGVIDTELFHLPDNDEGFHSAVDALPVEAIVDPVVEQLDAGTFEIYVPAWFHDVTAGKFANPQGFIEGTKEYARSLSS